MPLFVAITGKMNVEFDGEAAGGSGGEGSPRKPGEKFEASKFETTSPAPH